MSANSVARHLEQIAELAITMSPKSGSINFGCPIVVTGITNSGSQTISSGNLTLSSGNLTLTSGNALLSSGNLTLTSGTFTITAGSAVLTSGNLTLSSGNLLLSAGNATLTNGNLTLTSGGLTLTSGNLTITSGSIIRTAQTFKCSGGQAKAGSTAGWTVNAGNNLGTLATMAAGGTNSTLVVRIDGLHIGDTITGISAYASCVSTGNVCSLVGNLRKLVFAASASATDSSIASTNTGSVVTSTAMTITVTGQTEVVAAGSSYYILFTGNTGTGSTIELDSIEFTVTTS